MNLMNGINTEHKGMESLLLSVLFSFTKLYLFYVVGLW